jgi:hypothetical protein
MKRRAEQEYHIQRLGLASCRHNLRRRDEEDGEDEDDDEDDCKGTLNVCWLVSVDMAEILRLILLGELVCDNVLGHHLTVR